MARIAEQTIKTIIIAGHFIQSKETRYEKGQISKATHNSNFAGAFRANKTDNRPRGDQLGRILSKGFVSSSEGQS